MAAKFLIERGKVLIAQAKIESQIRPQLDVVLPEEGIVVLAVIFVDVGRSTRPWINIDTFVDGSAIHKVPDAMGHVNWACGPKFVVIVVLVYGGGKSRFETMASQ